ncbi:MULTISPECIES: DUF29 domain-containing protein [unclassified Anabaena]|uniref:DUF29 domain-containing protein n=1 Tax=unclassified Anabaena TaxID=2619674 RepID=UPI001447DD4D|nr:MULTISPECIES: DUF29 domain-containing protein [unclassified Anabaena]MTJ06566.1 DUF29 domain-containing protein [Anabaena sp. UHCC 0204]MTJ54335.1 DUF29 domain-containing protein [Anabaena sp. UHCC 0253]
MNLNTHDYDFYAWTQEQVHLLRTGQVNQIDFDHIADEIEDMGRSEKWELESRLEVLLIHLLKWQLQPNLRSRTWQLTIKEQRLRLEKLIAENPSFKSCLTDFLAKTYQIATISAERETGLSSFPETCPYSLTEIFAPDFLPSEDS